MRFTTFRLRTLFCRTRKNLKSAKVKLDLAKSRFDLFKRANNHFCCADVNFRLRVKFPDEKQELCDIIDCEVQVYLILFIHYFNFTKFISQLTFTNQESLLWSIIKFDNENISTKPSLLVFLINLGIYISLYFCIFLNSWLKAGKYSVLSYIFIIKSCSSTVLMPRYIWHFQWVTWSFYVSYWW